MDLKPLIIGSNCSSECCSYQQTGYQIGQNITTSLAPDQCTKITLICEALAASDPQIVMKVDSDDCYKCASQESLDEVKATLKKVLNNTGNFFVLNYTILK